VVSVVSMVGVVGVVDMASPDIAAPVSLATMAGLLVPVCGAKAVLLARRGPICRRRCVR
jgi:hypothetical protein